MKVVNFQEKLKRKRDEETDPLERVKNILCPKRNPDNILPVKKRKLKK